MLTQPAPDTSFRRVPDYLEPAARPAEPSRSLRPRARPENSLGATYIGPAGEAGGADDREALRLDGRSLVLK